MRNTKLLTRKFINENIRVNTAITSYPLCELIQTNSISSKKVSLDTVTPSKALNDCMSDFK